MVIYNLTSLNQFLPQLAKPKKLNKLTKFYMNQSKKLEY